MLCMYARDDTCHIPESSIKVEYEDRKQNDDIVRESSTTVRTSNFGFPPVGFANGGKTPPEFAPWHFVSLALFIQGRLIDKILAHFWWILVMS